MRAGAFARTPLLNQSPVTLKGVGLPSPPKTALCSVRVPPSGRGLGQKMAAAAELKLLEKSLGLSKGNKYSAQGERQVRKAQAAWSWRSRLLGPSLAGQTGGREGAACGLPTCGRSTGWDPLGSA